MARLSAAAMLPALSEADLAELAAAGISAAEAERQLALLAAPPQPARLLRPATVGDGVLRLDAERLEALERRGRDARDAGRISKFVPASGAASRMFRSLLAVRERGLAADAQALARAAAAGDPDADETLRFVSALPQLALAAPLAAAVGAPLAELARRAAREPLEPLLAALLDPDGLGAAASPKALLTFHLDGDRPVTAFEEQLAEGLPYLRDRGGRARFHFTIPPGTGARFAEALAAARARLDRSAGDRLEVAFSEQSRSTDTLALDELGRPARAGDGRLLLRPAGHGALLANLGATGADLLVIKNIDNVLPQHRHGEIARWKLVLAGLLVELARAAAERPARVCGVVPNTGEPGGGPFWVEGAGGRVTLQIVEASQVDLDDPRQREIWSSSTHFNPVDVVAALRDPTGRSFDLERFVDPATALVTVRSEGGRPLTVLERPGLWNGAMAGWSSVFVEVPGATFAPVKTVLDLARPEHAVAD